MDLQKQLQRAVELDERGEIEAAIACLDEVDGEIPDSAQHLKFVGQLYQRLGADEKSRRHLVRALEIDPRDPDLHLSLGYHNMDNAELELALDCFRAHLALAPDSAGGQVYLGRVLDFLGRLAEAETALQAALTLMPDDPGTHNQLGRVRLRRRNFDGAIKAFGEAARLQPGNVLAEIGIDRAGALIEMPAPDTASTEGAPATVICVKHGGKYGPEYVNRLHSMVTRNCTEAPRFVCFTENTEGLQPDIEVRPLPGDGLEGWWNKVALFRDNLPGVSGRLLYLDLDVVITASLDPLLCHPGEFVIMDNDYVPGFNSSVMLFEAGARPEIFSDFGAAEMARLDGDQDWIALRAPDAELWPHLWCVPFRLRAAKAPPSETKVVVFSGRPNPGDDPAPWIRDYWR